MSLRPGTEATLHAAGEPGAVPYDDYEAVVYDLDGTLVDLVVDWASLADELAARLREVGVDPEGIAAWGLLTAGQEAGIGDELDAMIAERERAGARRSERGPLAAEVSTVDRPVAVCSLNCEAACRIALETHDLADAVDAVVGRDTVETRKPDPEPLLAALDRLGVDPGRVVFVGDSERDAVTAERAGTAFRMVGE